MLKAAEYIYEFDWEQMTKAEDFGWINEVAKGPPEILLDSTYFTVINDSRDKMVKGS